jgi:hypothetical protein
MSIEVSTVNMALEVAWNISKLESSAAILKQQLKSWILTSFVVFENW